MCTCDGAGEEFLPFWPPQHDVPGLLPNLFCHCQKLLARSPSIITGEPGSAKKSRKIGRKKGKEKERKEKTEKGRGNKKGNTGKKGQKGQKG